MKMKMKKWKALAFALLLVCTTLSPAYATQLEDEIIPRLNVVIDADCVTHLSSTGFLTVMPSYSANDSQITRVVVTTFVEKRNLLLFWSRVDIGTTNNEWVDYGSNGDFSRSYSVQLPASGTYRITTTFDIYNGSSLLDSLEIVIKESY